MNDGGRAFPNNIRSYDGELGQIVENGDKGMSLRDWFAGQALSEAFRARREYVAAFTNTRDIGLAEIAATAYALADAMLAERERQS